MSMTAKRKMLLEAMVAIVEDSLVQDAEEDYSFEGLVEHHASLHNVPQSELEHEVALFEVHTHIQEARNDPRNTGAFSTAAVVEHLKDEFLQAVMP